MLSRVGLGLARPSRQLLFKSTLTRCISTVKASHDQEQDILVQQRRNRPESPHLTIYKPQITMVLSSLHRITGVAMAGAFYAVTVGYAAAGLTSFHFDSALIVSTFTSLPTYLQVGAKAVMAYPFAFHAFNGIRHLVWDLGKELSIKGVIRTGWTVVAATAVFGSYLAFLY